MLLQGGHIMDEKVKKKLVEGWNKNIEKLSINYKNLSTFTEKQLNNIQGKGSVKEIIYKDILEGIEKSQKLLVSIRKSQPTDFLNELALGKLHRIIEDLFNQCVEDDDLVEDFGGSLFRDLNEIEDIQAIYEILYENFEKNQ